MERGEEILKRLKAAVRIDAKRFVVGHTGRDPFEVLIAIVLSQNTNDRNAIKALRRLKERGLASLEKILEAGVEEIEDAIKPAGLYRQKARKIKELAERLKDRDPRELSREELMALPGIGPKTADVFLSFMGLSDEFPIDVHVRRVSRRLSIAKGSYEEMRRKLKEVFPREDYVFAHLALIEVGRRWCRPRNPRCFECPLRDVCEYARENAPQSSSSSSSSRNTRISSRGHV